MGRYIVDPGHGALIDPDFLAETFKQFPTILAATDTMGQLGRPRTSSGAPPAKHKIDTFLRALSVLPSHRSNSLAQTIAVKANWSRIIKPWVVSLLENIILSDEGPQTPEDVDFFEKTLWILPFFFSCPHCMDAMFDISSQSGSLSNLRLLVARVWFNVLKSEHRTGNSWSNVCASFCFDTSSRSREVALATAFSLLKSIAARFPGQLAPVFALYMDRETRRLPLMHVHELHNYERFISLLGMGLLGSDDGEAGESPFGTPTPSVVKYIIPPLVRLLSRLCRKILPKIPPTGGEEHPAYVIMKCTLHLIDGLSSGYLEPSYLLDAGFVDYIFHRYPFHTLWVSLKDEFERLIRILFGRIHRFLIYPTVLHRFLIIMKRIERSDYLERDMGVSSSRLRECWEDMKNEAVLLRSVRRNMKSMSSFLTCCRSECRPSQCKNPADLRFFRCAGCSLAIYCSRACQKLAWRLEGHRKECSSSRKGLEGKFHLVNTEPKSPKKVDIFFSPGGDFFIIPDEDFHFLSELIKDYLTCHSLKINEAAESYIVSLSITKKDLSRDQQSIQARARRPIIVLDFEPVENQNPMQDERFRFVGDLGELEEYYKDRGVYREDIEEFLVNWRLYGGENVLAVLSLFPGKAGRPYLMTQILSQRSVVPPSGCDSSGE
ncbi:hypothetical protein V5O48_015102 [Marasmius crinis-equi]|uniref:MYND-type domain-containing protein n=1 Tax=Marasmius crinis-equi TaxID=585013 RepID=A0ABR3EVG0_9AGAR